MLDGPQDLEEMTGQEPVKNAWRRGAGRMSGSRFEL
jgi:hypothetical protein